MRAPAAQRPGLGRRPTERLHPLAERLDRLSPGALLRAIHAEDRRAIEALDEAMPSLERALALATRSLRTGGRLLYVGAGTSGRLAALDAAECPPTFGTRPRDVVAIVAGGRPALWRAVEGAEDDARDGAARLKALMPTSRDTIVGISASGDTPFVLGALRAARRAGASTVLLCGTSLPSGRRASDVVVRLDTGPEIVAGSTRLKAGTAQKLALNALSTASMVLSGRVVRGRMAELRPTSQKLRERAERSVMALAGIGRGRARALLGAGGSVKLAVAMALTGATAAEARRVLAAEGGLGEWLRRSGPPLTRTPRRRRPRRR
ncbi:MAG: N-acetylmuramic acid 6-phosphate etherase [Deltaproteobacteria bacterium]